MFEVLLYLNIVLTYSEIILYKLTCISGNIYTYNLVRIHLVLGNSTENLRNLRKCSGRFITRANEIICININEKLP